MAPVASSAPHLSALGPAPAPRRCRLLDLAGDPAQHPLWHPGCLDERAPAPGPGRPSPMGFWVAEGDADGPGFPIRVVEPGAEGREPPADVARPAPGHRRRPAQSLRMKAPQGTGGEMFLAIGPGGARIEADAATWETLSEPVLLAVAQYARFLAVDAALDRLTEAARGDLGHAVLPGPGTIRDRKRLARVAGEVRALLIDLPHFQGPLSDPLAFCSSERAASAYETLSEKLHLEEWSEAIDDRAEAVEDTYEAATEKLFEYKNFAWEVLLEVTIVIILFAELAFMAYETFSP